jgi:hypothetical protein
MGNRWKNFLEWTTRESSKKATIAVLSSAATLMAAGLLVLVALVAIRQGQAQTLVWPSVTVFLLLMYRPILERVLEGSPTVKLTFGIVTVTVPLATLLRSVEENCDELTPDQWKRLQRINDGYEEFDYMNPEDIKVLRPLRNAGLIRPYPTVYLEDGVSKHVRITAIGKLVLEQSSQQR